MRPSAGSPPHLRGKQLFQLRFFRVNRITPAPAGKTRPAKTIPLNARDHPRTCGENIDKTDTKRPCIGSPPHLRGKQPVNRDKRKETGITPAPAGKTLATKWVDESVEDHPRTCGENAVKVSPIERTSGSPPHLRGKLEFLMQVREDGRITPAPAGKTFHISSKHYQPRDHPRTCGENSGGVWLAKPDEGSPPHLRGKPYLTNRDYLEPRITPAPAGKTNRTNRSNVPY